MVVDYPKLIIPEELKPFIREVIPGQGLAHVPRGWTGIMIYHPATEQYYSTKSDTPAVYEQVIREQKGARWENTAIALRKMIDHHPGYQFFVLPVLARETIEGWMAKNGKRRVSTCMGEAAVVGHVAFKVYSPYNRIARYITAPVDTPREKIITQANSGMAGWLKSSSQVNRHERETMRVALRSKSVVNTKVFEPTAEVTRTGLVDGLPYGRFRSVCNNMNLQQIRNFIATTTMGS